MTTEEYKKNIEKIHPEYDYSKVEYVNAKTKILIKCKIHNIWFYQNPDNLKRKIGCPLCKKEKIAFSNSTKVEEAKKMLNKYNDNFDIDFSSYKNASSKFDIKCKKCGKTFKKTLVKLKENELKCPYCEGRNRTTDEFIAEAKKIYGDKYDYSKTVYKTVNDDVVIICPKHGEFIQNAHLHLRGRGCPKCKCSHGENIISSFLKEKGLIEEKDYFREFIFDDLKDKAHLRFDFYIPSKRVTIEFQGAQHFKPMRYRNSNEKFATTVKHDNMKREYCEKNNIHEIEIKYDQIHEISSILSFVN